MTSLVVLFLALVGAAAVARLAPAHLARRFDVTPLLAGRRAAWVIGTLTAAICAYVWGHLIAPTAIVHDEASYLLQARIFAHGAFAMPAPPLPEFFEQFHVYVTPAYASKYPPGHALLLSLGVLLGWPALVPLLLDGLSGAMVFLLGRRIANPVVGLLSWFLWITAYGALRPLASYFSETTTVALWLVGWWALLEWRDTGRRGWLAAVAACVAWCAITRPLTAVAYAVPVAAAVLVLVARRRAWGELWLPLVVGVAIVSLIPYANMRTTGDWRVMPYAQYSDIYFPWDAPGLGIRGGAPRRALPPDMAAFAAQNRPLHAGYVASALPRAYMQRLGYVALDMFGASRMPLAIGALVALPLIGVEVAFALGTSLFLVATYLSFMHLPGWTLYYTETLPVLAFLSAAGLWALFAGVGRADRHGALSRESSRAAFATGLFVVAVLPLAARTWFTGRTNSVATQSYQRVVAATIDALEPPKVIVFVRYAPWHNIHKSLITNDPDLASSHAWVVYDRGADNARLLRAAPDRVPYVYDEAHYSVDGLPR